MMSVHFVESYDTASAVNTRMIWWFHVQHNGELTQGAPALLEH
jgi:hypothetical protein